MARRGRTARRGRPPSPPPVRRAGDEVGEVLVGPRSPTDSAAVAMAASRAGSSISATTGAHPLRGQLGIVDEHATAGADDGRGVETLLAVADRQRDVDGRQPDRGQLADGVGPGAARRRGRPRHRRAPSGRRTGGRRTAAQVGGTRSTCRSFPARVRCRTWMPASRRAATAPANASLSRAAPSDPPVTRTVGQRGSRPSAAAPRRGSAGPVERRRSRLPQRHPDDRGRGAAACPGTSRPPRRRPRAPSRLARPGRAFCSCTTTGTPRRRAAR